MNTLAARWSSHLAVAAITATALFWWILTDRLDLPKLALLLLSALVSAGCALFNKGRLGVSAAAASLVVSFAVLAAPAEMNARIEGWAGWLAAVVLFAAAREADPRYLTKALAVLAVGLALIGALQAAGSDIFNQDLSGMHGRRVVGTLGGPGHYGWTLALLLPWLGSELVAGFESGKKKWLWLSAWSLAACALVLAGSRVAWMMGLFAAPLWLERRVLKPIALGFLVAVLLAVAIDAATDRARLEQRLFDTFANHGTAAGRLYLWRVYAAAAPQWLGRGAGPEGFVRSWPGWQRDFLTRHPGDGAFFSDLRHAHADVVEIGADYGLPGLVLGVLFGLFLRRRAADGCAIEPAVRAAAATLLAVGVGGLAAPLLHFAPTLAIAAVAAAIAAGPARHALPRPLVVVALVGPLLAAGILVDRTRSEILRSRATACRVTDPQRARHWARIATQLDPRNPRAWMEVAMTASAAGDLAAARAALRAAARDLPNDEILTALAAMESVAPPKKKAPAPPQD